MKEIKKLKCLWYESVQNGTTGLDVTVNHPLYHCRICKDPYNYSGSCLEYRSIYLYEKKHEVKK